MGGRGSGTPPSREKLENALRLHNEDGVPLREVARRTGICRDTLAKYRDDWLRRSKVRRCPECGSVVTMPCLACSPDVRVAAAKRDRRLRKAARRVSGRRLRPA